MMISRKRLGALSAAGGLLFALSAMPAQATPILTVFDGTHTGTGSLIAPGAYEFNGHLGSWTVNVDVGQTKPGLGSATEPDMDLSVVATGGTGNLYITFVDSGFVGTGSTNFLTSVGGTNPTSLSSVTLQSWTSQGSLSTLGAFGHGAFSGSDLKSQTLSGLYSLTLYATVNHSNSRKTTTFDAEVQAVPEPSTLALLGATLLGSALFVGRRRAAKTL